MNKASINDIALHYNPIYYSKINMQSLYYPPLQHIGIIPVKKFLRKYAKDRKSQIVIKYYRDGCTMWIPDKRYGGFWI